jgi:hypothetical protein
MMDAARVDDAAALVLVRNIPPDWHAAELRWHFRAFTEGLGFVCFHFKHRPDPARQGRLMCIASVLPSARSQLLEDYDGKPWEKEHGETPLDSACLLQPLPAGAAHQCMALDLSFPKSIGSLQELHPPRGNNNNKKRKKKKTFIFGWACGRMTRKKNCLAGMPHGNVGTPLQMFLESIRLSLLPPSVIRKLRLRFPRNVARRCFSELGFDYATGSLLTRKRAAASAASSSSSSSSSSFSATAATGDQVDDDDHSSSEELEEWDRADAQDEQDRAKDRLFEEKIEVTWDKGSSGLVFYTDAAYWAEGRCFDTQTADDFDLELGLYDGTGPLDEGLKTIARLRERGDLPPVSRGRRHDPDMGLFERHTRGIGSRIMRRHGWQPGTALGQGSRKRHGITEPLNPESQPQHCKKGLGYRGEKIQRHAAARPPVPHIIGCIYDDNDQDEPSS